LNPSAIPKPLIELVGIKHTLVVYTFLLELILGIVKTSISKFYNFGTDLC
jgi:hypothetical protein